MNLLRADLWIDRFCAEMHRLGVAASPERIVEIAWKRQTTHGWMKPEVAARAEWDLAPPHDH